MAALPLPVDDTPRVVRPDGVVVAAPSFDQDLSFGQGIEDLPVQELIAKGSVEALAVAILLARHLALCRSMLPECAADPPLGHRHHGPDMIDATPATRGA
jgi:hypothetical protein